MAKDKFEQFLIGLGAAVQLINRAAKNGFFIEYVCLATSVIDATLRMALILQYQLKNRTDDIPNEYLFQSDEDKIISEREIYRRALKEKIVEQDLFKQLESLYKDRNRIVHRYIISDITTDQVLRVAIQYGEIIPVINDRIRVLEDKQVELNVGMTKSGPEDIEKKLMSELEEMIPKKHQNPFLNYVLKKKWLLIFSELMSQLEAKDHEALASRFWKKKAERIKKLIFKDDLGKEKLSVEREWILIC